MVRFDTTVLLRFGTSSIWGGGQLVAKTKCKIHAGEHLNLSKFTISKK